MPKKKKQSEPKPILNKKAAEKLNAILEVMCDLNDDLLEIIDENEDMSYEFKNASDRLMEAEMWIERGFENNGYAPEDEEDEDDEEDTEEEDEETEAAAPKDSE